MRSQFDQVLNINAAGEVRACGDFDWGDGEEEATVTVTITQKDLKVTGGATSQAPLDADTAEWMLKVPPTQPNREFEKGPAEASGRICAMGKDISMQVFNWTQDVELA